jgi:hypothetical protein
VTPEEARARCLLDVFAPRVEEVLAGLHRAARVLELLDFGGELVELVLQLGPTLGERRGLRIHQLDVALDRRPLRLDRRHSLADGGQVGLQPFPFPVGAGQGSLERLDLRPTSRRLLADPPAALLDLAPTILIPTERGLGRVERPLLRLEVLDRRGQQPLDPGELLGDGVHPDGARGLRGELGARGRLTIDRLAIRLLATFAVERGGAEPLLRLGERARRSGARIRGGEDALVERVQPLPRPGAFLEALVPATAPALLLALKRAQPRRRQQPREAVGLRGQRFVLLGHLRLLLQRLQLAPELAEDVREPQQILVQPGQLALRPLLPTPVLRDPGGLLDVLPSVLRAREEHLLELPLTDDRVERAADPRLGQQLLHVHQSDRLSSDPVLGVAAAEDRSRDLDLGHRDRDLARRVVDHELDLGHPERGPGWGAREDHVGHLSAAQRPRSLLPEGPADRVDEVRLARPVGAHDHGHAGNELQDRLVREALETPDLDLPEEHRADANSRVIRGVGGARHGDLPHHPEAAFTRWRLVASVDVGDRCSRGTSPAPRDHSGHRVAVSLERGLHGSVIPVPYPPGDATGPRLPRTRRSEEHALHVARDHDVDPSPERHDWQGTLAVQSTNAIGDPRCLRTTHGRRS